MLRDETELMHGLAELVHRPATLRFLEGVSHALRQQLEASPQAKSTHAAVPLATYSAQLPEGIGSSWVFVLRPGYVHPPERHPNSVQRMFALDSPGAMEIWEDDRWAHRPLAPGAGRAGLSIPAYAWHRPALLGEVWGVVSFHTVAAGDLIEEIGDPTTGHVESSLPYLKR